MTDATEADEVLDAIEAAWKSSADVLSYTVNGRTVTRNSPQQMIDLHKYMEGLKQRAIGVRRTKVDFS